MEMTRTRRRDDFLGWEWRVFKMRTYFNCPAPISGHLSLENGECPEMGIYVGITEN